MKYFKIKEFNIPKFLFIFVGLLSCVGALCIQNSLSYFHTTYGFANTFQTAPTGSVSVYQEFANPTPLYSGEGPNWGGINCPKKLFIENTSGEGGVSEYVRVAYPQVMGVGTSGEDYPYWYDSAYKVSCHYGPWFNKTDGIYSGYRSLSNMPVNSVWTKYGEWYYYKTPLTPAAKLQLTDSLGNSKEANKKSTEYRTYTLTFIVETLPSNVSDEDFKNTWGVSKEELKLS